VINRISRTLRFIPISFRSQQERGRLWPPTSRLDAKHVRDCRLFENRDAMLEYLPRESVCAEVGIDQGIFSEKILRITFPTKLHLIDISPSFIQNAKLKFARQVEQETVETHVGDSASLLETFPDEYFDWVYIDGDHTYRGAKRDLEAALPKLKPKGLLVLNDYIFFAASELAKYGVVEAVNEFCVVHNFKFVYLALQERMFNDVVLGRIEG
jgi:phospholipid N-methyltransferase